MTSRNTGWKADLQGGSLLNSLCLRIPKPPSLLQLEPHQLRTKTRRIVNQVKQTTWWADCINNRKVGRTVRDKSITAMDRISISLYILSNNYDGTYGDPLSGAQGFKYIEFTCASNLLIEFTDSWYITSKPTSSTRSCIYAHRTAFSSHKLVSSTCMRLHQ